LKRCEWFATWMTGPRLIGNKRDESCAKADASWEILK